jgi:hypothetical protein
MADPADSAGLARKLGITLGCSIWLLDAPAPSAALLRSVCPPDVALTETEADEADESGNGLERFDLIFLWPQRLDGLTERLAALQWRIVPSGAIWLMLPKKAVARQRGIAFSWEEMQAAALQTDLVDNKGATFSDEEYGTRFVLRRDRRQRYAGPQI